MIILPLSLLSILPLLMYLADGYYEKKYRKGIIYIGGFIGVTLFSSVLLKIFGMYFVVSIPLLLLIFLIISKSYQKKSDLK